MLDFFPLKNNRLTVVLKKCKQILDFQPFIKIINYFNKKINKIPTLQ